MKVVFQGDEYQQLIRTFEMEIKDAKGKLATSEALHDEAVQKMENAERESRSASRIADDWERRYKELDARYQATVAENHDFRGKLVLATTECGREQQARLVAENKNRTADARVAEAERAARYAKDEHEQLLVKCGLWFKLVSTIFRTIPKKRAEHYRELARSVGLSETSLGI